MTIMVRRRGADGESHTAKSMLTNQNCVSVERNGERELHMSNSESLSLCFEFLNQAKLKYNPVFTYIFWSSYRKDAPAD